MQIASYLPSKIEYDLQALEQADYHQGITAFMEAFGECFKGKAAIYQFGEVRTPSISDLDLLVVVDDAHWSEAEICARKACQSTERLKYLCVHPPLVICVSLADSLPYLHALENPQPITSGWNPLENIAPQDVDEDSRLMRHAVWNSFMRMAALEMDNKPIGLRRALLLMHNLHLTAVNGNELLEDPLEITLDTTNIRHHALGTPTEQLHAYMSNAIREIVETLNAVDHRLDMQLQCAEAATHPHKWVLSLRGRFILPARLTHLTSYISNTRILEHARLVWTPLYLLALGALISHRLGNSAPQLSPLNQLPLPFSLAQRIPVTAYETHLVKALKLAREHKVIFPFVLPFSPRAQHYGIRGYLLSHLRKWSLIRQLRRATIARASPNPP